MLKKLLLAGIAASALALNAPVAMAHPATGDCGFESVQQEDATGQNYEGVAYGYAVHDDGGAVSVTCYVAVNGTPVSYTPTGSGTGVATTQGRVTFSAGDTDNVQLCAAITADGNTTTSCGDSTNSQIPPQEVIDLLDQIFAATGAVDPLLCPALAGLAGSYGAITINGEGDVIVADPIGKIWDCPPYDA